MSIYFDGQPYVYAIMWSHLNMAYIGVRYARGCHPNDLWESYFTSSHYVRSFREKHGEPDHIEIIDTFLTPKQATDAEFEIIRDFALHKNSVFLNKGCHGAIAHDHEVCARISEGQRRHWESMSDERRAAESARRCQQFSDWRESATADDEEQRRQSIRDTWAAKPDDKKGDHSRAGWAKKTPEQLAAWGQRTRQRNLEWVANTTPEQRSAQATKRASKYAKRYDCNGSMLTLKQMSEQSGIAGATLAYRMKANKMTPQDAMDTPLNEQNSLAGQSNKRGDA